MGNWLGFSDCSVTVSLPTVNSDISVSTGIYYGWRGYYFGMIKGGGRGVKICYYGLIFKVSGAEKSIFLGIPFS